MIIFAGFLLNLRKPNIDPAKAEEVINIVSLLYLVDSNKNDMAAVNVIPDARPSNPSIQLIAFIIPAIQTVEIIKLTKIGKLKFKL